MKRLVIVFVALCGAAAIGAAVWSGTQPTQEELLTQACEKILVERLVSPSSYVRIEVVGWRREPADRNEYLRLDDPEIAARVAKLAASDPAYALNRKRQEEIFDSVPRDRVSGVLRYEAANSFGASMQSASLCAIFLPTGDPLEIRPLSDIRVDNMTALDWATERLIAAQNLLRE